MFLVIKKNISRREISDLIKAVENSGIAPHILESNRQIIIGISENCTAENSLDFENFPEVEQVVQNSKPYKLASKLFPSQKSIVKIGNSEIGGGNLAIVAGPCAVETESQVLRTAEIVSASGAKFFRGGAFKPRTSPYAFQGLGEDGLKILAKVRENFNLNVITEAMDKRGVDLVEKYADCIQIGARNMQNFSLLKYVGQTRKPVLLKRNFSATLEELLLAAEYIMSEGNHKVVLCERGIRTFSDHSRNTLDLSIVPAVQKLSHLPIIVDPSHGTGKNFMVSPMARAAVAVGADGLIIEVHPCPEEALCDGDQALNTEQYLELISQLKILHQTLFSETFESAAV